MHTQTCLHTHTDTHIQTVWEQWSIVLGQPLCHVSKRHLSHANVPVRAEKNGSHDAVNPDLLSNTKEGLNRGLVIAGCQILPPTMQAAPASATHWGLFQVAFIYCCYGKGPFDWWGVDVNVCVLVCVCVSGVGGGGYQGTAVRVKWMALLNLNTLGLI